MKAVREKMLATPWAEEWEKKRTMFSYGEEMSTDPLEAMMLKQFVHMAQPKHFRSGHVCRLWCYGNDGGQPYRAGCILRD